MRMIIFVFSIAVFNNTKPTVFCEKWLKLIYSIPANITITPHAISDIAHILL